MKAWVALLLAALLAVPLVLVAILIRGTVPRKQASNPVVETAPKPLTAPVDATAPVVDVRQEVARLLELLIEAVKSGDFMARGLIQDELRALGLPAVAPMREDILGNEEGWHRSFKLHEAIRDTLLGMASPECGAEMLKSWFELDEGKHPFNASTAGMKLRYFADVVVKSPPPDARKRITEMYAKAERQTIKKSLIELMGRLLARFPELRDDLLRIMKEDPDFVLRNAAVHALGSADPLAALPDAVKRMKEILGDSKNQEDAELEGLMETILKALPFDQALDLLKKEFGGDLAIHQVGKLNKLGFTLGWRCCDLGNPNLEVMLARASAEESPAMRILYLGAVGMAPLRKNTDSRLTDLAVNYLNSSSGTEVRSHALSMITALNRDEATLLGAYDKAWKEGGDMAFFAAGQLKFHLGRNPDNAAAAERLRIYVIQGSAETRLQVLRGLRWGGGHIPPSIMELLKTAADSDPDEKIRQAARQAAGLPP